ncbi:MAG: class I SAM-dependent methyltransferase [Peptococcaceae bacterium]|nr:class I SAM-dependent methyltransferase [Peptococcaceae bacterium]
MRSFIVTTSLGKQSEAVKQARWLSTELGVSYVPRGKDSLETLQEKYGVSGIVVVTNQKVCLFSGGKRFFFHPDLAKVRIKGLRTGKTDQMVKAMDLRPGDEVLDCTLGLASDALVASYVVGDTGRVVGLEAVKLIAVLVRDGLQKYPARPADLAAAMHRIEVVWVDYNDFLRQLDDNSFDVVYFDPMFRCPVMTSDSMVPLRALADPRPLDAGSLREAYRVARKRVVFKERRGSPEFVRLGFNDVEGGKYASVAYGVLKKDGTGQ